MDKLLANKFNAGLTDKEIMSITVKETKLILDVYHISTNGFDCAGNYKHKCNNLIDRLYSTCEFCHETAFEYLSPTDLNDG